MKNNQLNALANAMAACRENALTEIVQKSDSFLSAPECNALSAYRDQVMAGNREGALWRAGEAIFGESQND